MKNLRLSAFFLLAPLLLNALTLEEAVQSTIDSNPQMQKRISDYGATRYDVDRARAGYKPTVDLSAGIGPEHTEMKAVPQESDLTRKEASLVVTENLFSGFNTSYDVEEQKKRLDAARYYVLQEAEALSLRVSETYLQVLMNKELLDLEKENVETHERISTMTREKMSAGLGRRSDLEQTEARMALAYANYITQQNNYQDSIINFERIYGRTVSSSSMTRPRETALPADTLEAMIRSALHYSPTLQVRKRNVEAEHSRYGKEKSGFYPRVDAELSASYQNDVDGIENDDRAYRAMLRLYYNLYNGGRDEATRLQNLELITSEQLVLSEDERAVVEKLKLAWMTYQYYEHRIRCLELHAELSKKTAGSYAEEYHLGRRSLLDLLNVELEYIDARKEVVKAKNQHTYAYYRILEAVGIIDYTMHTDTYAKIDLEKPEGITLAPIASKPMVEYGENGEYLDVTEVCKATFEPIAQTLYDPAADRPSTPAVIIEETAAGTQITITDVYFAFGSAELDEKSKQELTPVTDRLRADDKLVVEINGHTDNVGGHDDNMRLSVARADAAKRFLIGEGIDAKRISTFGHSYDAPIADNTTPEGRRVNRRIEFMLKQGSADL